MPDQKREKSLRRSKVLFFLGLILAILGYVFAVTKFSPVMQLFGLYMFVGGVSFTPIVALKIFWLMERENAKA